MENYEIELEKNNKRNDKFINEFEEWLNQKKLTPRTINKHLCNIDLFINSYLTYYEVIKMEEGVIFVCDFLGDWFIRKCAWSSANSIKEMAASIKKFYQCMSEKNYIAKEKYQWLTEVLKEKMDKILEEMKHYEEDLFEDYFW